MLFQGFLLELLQGYFKEFFMNFLQELLSGLQPKFLLQFLKKNRKLSSSICPRISTGVQHWLFPKGARGISFEVTLFSEDSFNCWSWWSSSSDFFQSVCHTFPRSAESEKTFHQSEYFSLGHYDMYVVRCLVFIMFCLFSLWLKAEVIVF